MTLPRRRRTTAALGAGLLALLALGACSSSGGSGVSAGSAIGAPANPEVNPGADAQAGPGVAGQSDAKSGSAGSQSASGSAAKPGTTSSSTTDLVAADKVVRNAALTVQVDDVEAAAAESRRVAVTAGGSVLSENSTAVPRTNNGTVDKTGSRSTLALAVPADTLDRVLDDLGKLGTIAARTSSATDVTKTYVDTQSRITTMKSSLDQLRALLAKTSDLTQIVNLETEISRRQADLDSLQAQLNALDKKVAMSTVNVTLTTAAPVVVPDQQEAGFLGGLQSGWRGFLKAGGAILTVIGAVLPFIVALAILAAPVVWWRRRHRNAPASTEYAQWGPGPSGSGGNGGGDGGNGNGNGGNGNGNGGSGGSDPEGGAGAPEESEREPEPAGVR